MKIMFYYFETGLKRKGFYEAVQWQTSYGYSGCNEMSISCYSIYVEETQRTQLPDN